MERRVPKLPDEFEDLAECYEYYLDLLGTYDETEGLLKTKKQKKETYNDIYEAFCISRRHILSRSKLSAEVGKTELNELKEEFRDEYGIRTLGQRLKDAGRKMLSPGRKLLSLLKPGGKNKQDEPKEGKVLEDKPSSPALEHNQTQSDVFIEAPDEEKPSEETTNHNENSQKD